MTERFSSFPQSADNHTIQAGRDGYDTPSQFSFQVRVKSSNPGDGAIGNDSMDVRSHGGTIWSGQSLRSRSILSPLNDRLCLFVPAGPYNWTGLVGFLQLRVIMTDAMLIHVSIHCLALTAVSKKRRWRSHHSGCAPNRPCMLASEQSQTLTFAMKDGLEPKTEAFLVCGSRRCRSGFFGDRRAVNLHMLL
jgi:hypothetical protein